MQNDHAGARGRIVVISAAVGAGHDAATRELSSRLRARGFRVDSHDFMELLPWGVGRRAVRGHNTVLDRAPWCYGFLFAVGNRTPLVPPLTRALLWPARGRLLRLVDGDVRAVVSTYPLASQVLGPLRRSGRLRTPAVTYATDFAVHRHWVAPGVDAHLAVHRIGAAQAHRQGGRGARVGGALVSDRFRPASPAARHHARLRFGLPPGRVALIAAGSWGVGEIEATVADITATGVAVPVVLCGRNAGLRHRLRHRGVRHALGWVEDMPTLLHGADVLVENAGGAMALEAMASGVPVVTYRPIPGHGTESAAALARAGLTTWIRDRRALGRLLVEVAEGPRGRWQRAAARRVFETDAAQAIAALAGRVPQPSTGELRSGHRWAAVAGVAAVLTVAALRARWRRPA